MSSSSARPLPPGRRGRGSVRGRGTVNRVPSFRAAAGVGEVQAISMENSVFSAPEAHEHEHTVVLESDTAPPSMHKDNTKTVENRDRPRESGGFINSPSEKRVNPTASLQPTATSLPSHPTPPIRQPTSFTSQSSSVNSQKELHSTTHAAKQSIPANSPNEQAKPTEAPHAIPRREEEHVVLPTPPSPSLRQSSAVREVDKISQGSSEPLSGQSTTVSTTQEKASPRQEKRGNGLSINPTAPSSHSLGGSSNSSPTLLGAHTVPRMSPSNWTKEERERLEREAIAERERRHRRQAEERRKKQEEALAWEQRLKQSRYGVYSGGTKVGNEVTPAALTSPSQTSSAPDIFVKHSGSSQRSLGEPVDYPSHSSATSLRNITAVPEIPEVRDIQQSIAGLTQETREALLESIKQRLSDFVGAKERYKVDEYETNSELFGMGFQSALEYIQNLAKDFGGLQALALLPDIVRTQTDPGKRQSLLVAANGWRNSNLARLEKDLGVRSVSTTPSDKSSSTSTSASSGLHAAQKNVSYAHSLPSVKEAVVAPQKPKDMSSSTGHWKSDHSLSSMASSPEDIPQKVDLPKAQLFNDRQLHTDHSEDVSRQNGSQKEIVETEVEVKSSATSSSKEGSVQRHEETEQLTEQNEEDVWVEVFDEASQEPYFFHKITNEVTWERPANARVIPVAALLDHDDETSAYSPQQQEFEDPNQQKEPVDDLTANAAALSLGASSHSGQIDLINANRPEARREDTNSSIRLSSEPTGPESSRLLPKLSSSTSVGSSPDEGRFNGSYSANVAEAAEADTERITQPESVEMDREESLSNSQQDDAVEWIEIIDESSGDPYYFNERLQITQWDKPNAPYRRLNLDEQNEQQQEHDSHVSESPLSQKLSPQESEVQNTSGVSSLRDGVSVREEKEDVSLRQDAHLHPVVGKQESLHQQSSLFGDSENDDEEETEARAGGLHKEEARGVVETEEDPDWIEVLDESSGDYYYFNPKTNETQWEEPETSGKILRWTQAANMIVHQ